jgi:hypothetical protein
MLGRSPIPIVRRGMVMLCKGRHAIWFFGVRGFPPFRQEKCEDGARRWYKNERSLT